MSYIEFHSHILFDVDHGVQTRQEFQKLLVAYSKAGFGTIVVTPHVYHPQVSTKVKNIRENFQLACSDAEKVGIRLVLGSELYVGSQLELKTIPIKGKYALCEFPTTMKPLNLGARLKQLTDKGLEIIIAHVERYSWLKPDSEDCQKLKDFGAWFQMNVGSVEKRFGEEYLKQDMIDIIASDNHGDATLPARLAACLAAHPVIKDRMEAFDI